MKQLKVIIQPDKLEAVKESLTDIGLKGLIIAKVEGFAQERERKLFVRSAEYGVNSVPMATVERLSRTLPSTMPYRRSPRRLSRDALATVGFFYRTSPTR